jgi:hypothetical protein
MKSVVAECGHRERAGMVQDGECRECRGVGRGRRVDTGRQSRPDDEAAAYRADATRMRIILNDRGVEGDL